MAPDRHPTPTGDELRALVRRHIEQGFNRGDWTVCETTLADDYTAYYGAEGRANVGRGHYVQVCKFLRKSFPDVNITIEDIVTEGDKVVMRYTERGTLTGRTFLGVEPAGQAYAKPGTTVYRVVGGRLAESWGVEDTLGWFQQLGAIAPLPGT
ncbi:MAG TPA: ester cyclase [Acidimicrobiia bacterium]|jgi:steroid delta-isomerase-like uncharacterized protein